MHAMHRLGLTPPHPLPAERCKGQPRKGVGEDGPRQPYCHTLLARMFVPPWGKCCPFFLFVFSVSGLVSFAVFCRSFFLGSFFWKNFRERTLFLGGCGGRANSCHWFLFPQGGNAVRFFLFVFFVSGLASFAVFCRSSLLRVAFWKNFRERTFVFGWLGWSCVFWWVFATVFALFFGVSLPKLFGKILLMSGLVFSGFVLSSFVFFVVVVGFGFFFKRYSSGSNRTPPHTHLSFLFFFFLCPAAFVGSARFGRASRFLAFCRGAILGPGGFWDSPWTF